MRALLASLVRLTGFDPRQPLTALLGAPRFLRDLVRFRRGFNASAKEFPLGTPAPFIGDWWSESGVAKGHYFHQDLVVAQWLHADAPELHIDVGSRIDGFVAHVAAFREIEVLDIRPLSVPHARIKFRQCDLLAVPEELNNRYDSVSCLHALEHFGLGRYGDKVDYYGYIAGLSALHGLLKPQGRLYLSVPMGPQRVEFNSQRVFDLTYLKSLIADRFEIERFCYVTDGGELVLDADADSPEAGDNFGCRFGCAIFSLRKR